MTRYPTVAAYLHAHPPTPWPVARTARKAPLDWAIRRCPNCGGWTHHNWRACTTCGRTLR